MDNAANLLQQARDRLQERRVEEALVCYEAVLTCAPNDPHALIESGVLLNVLGQSGKALVRFQMAAKLYPANGEICFLMGDAAENLNNISLAVDHYRHTLRLVADHARASLRLANLLRHNGLLAEAEGVLQTALSHQGQEADLHQELSKVLAQQNKKLSADVHRQLFYHYKGEIPPHRVPQHSLFLNRQEALSEQGNRVSVNVFITLPQLCYYAGESLPGAADNLIAIPAGQWDTFLQNSFLHWPSRIAFSVTKPQEVATALSLATVLDLARHTFMQATTLYSQWCRTIRPLFVADQPLRILLVGSRYTTVVRYCLEDLSVALQGLNCQVHLVQEENDRQNFSDSFYFMRVQCSFQAHVVISINAFMNSYFHEDVFKVTWWQDAMDALLPETARQWHEREMVYTFNQGLIPLLDQAGAPAVQMQPFCYREDVFCLLPHLPRRRKIVFVGSIHGQLAKNGAEEKIWHILTRMLAGGETITVAVIEQLANQFAVAKERITWDLIPAREVAVRWLCQCADLMAVEVYGYGWEGDPLVQPFYRGVVAHGDDLARLYNESSHVLAPHPFDLQSQRLVESVACGCQPVVYDCRDWAARPHWDEHFLWFNSLQGLRQCLTVENSLVQRQTILEGRGYGDFARNILQEVNLRLTVADMSS